MWLWIWALGACAPGYLRSREGREPLRSAWFAAVEDDQPVSSMTVLLSNSDLACELPETVDPGEVEEALSVQAAGLYREGAAVLLFNLYSAAAEWSGAYEIAEGGDGGPRPDRTVAVTWWKVVEAEVESQDGVVVSYTPGDAPGDYVFVPRVPSPGSIEVALGEDALTGSFVLDSLDLSGGFEAAPCDADSALFASLGYTF